MRNLSTIVVCLLFFVTTYAQTTEYLLEQAQSEYNSAQYTKAIRTYNKLVKKGEKQAGFSGLILSHIENGWKLGMNNGDGTSDYQQALEYGQQLIALDSNNVDNLLLFGYALQFNSAFEHALIQYEKARQIDPNNGYVYYRLWTMQPADPNIRLTHEYVEKALNLNPKIYELHMELGDYYKNINNAEKALESYNKSIAISPTWKALFSAGNLYLFSGDLSKARDYLNRCLELFPEFGWGMMALAGVNLAEGNLEDAVNLLQKGLSVNPATQQYLDYYKQYYPDLSNYSFETKTEIIDQWDGYPEGYGDAVKLAQEGYLWDAAAEFEKAYDAYSKDEYAEPQYLQSMQSWILHCYREVGMYREASESGLIALDLAIKHDLTTDQAAIYANLAVIYEQWGDYKRSISMHRKSIELLKQYGQKENLYAAYGNLGMAYRQSGNFDSAVYFHEKAIQEAESLGKRDQITSWKEMALSFASQGNFELAEKFILQSLEALKELNDVNARFDVYLAASNVYRILGKYELANDYWIEIKDEFFERFLLHQPQVAPFVSNLITIQMNLGQDDYVGSNYTILDTNLKFQINNYFPALSSEGKTRFYNTLKDYYEIFSSYVFHYGGKSDETIKRLHQNQLLAKGILFNASSKMRRTIASDEDPKVKELFNEWRRSRSLLSKTLTATNLPDAPILIDSLESKIDKIEIQLSSLTDNTIKFEEKFEVSDIGKLLESNEAAVEIIRFRKYDFKTEEFMDSVYYAALIIKGANRNEITSVLLPNGNDLESTAFRKYSNSINYDIRDVSSYAEYWSPIAKELQDVDKVYLAADGVYHKLSLNTLLNPSTNKYLLEETELRVVTSTRDIRRKTTRLPTEGTAHLVGYPNFKMSQEDVIAQIKKPEFKYDENTFLTVRGDFELTELPGTYAEIQSVKDDLLQSNLDVNVLLENDALEENVKSIQNPTILHLATHGFFNPSEEKDTNPLFNSGLYFAGAASKKEGNNSVDDGILTAYEAMNMYLDETYLVVLSACETGLGEVENGEGVFGLQRAFLIAGAESLVMSYWKVNDQTTMLLMEAFYDELVKTRDKHQAFVQAQLKVKEQYPSPKYWGAFSIIGK